MNHARLTYRSRLTTAILCLALSLGIPGSVGAQSDKAVSEEEVAALAASAEAAGALGIYNGTDGAYVVVMPEANMEAISAASIAAPPGLTVRVEQRAIDQGQVDLIMSTLRDRSWHPDAREHAFGSHLDLELGQVVIEGDASPDVFAKVLARFAGLVVYRETGAERLSRFTDTIPHEGGAALTSNGVDRCTSGFTVVHAGQLKMITAGHCWVLGTAVRSPGNSSPFGTVTNRASFPSRDLEMLGGSSYTGKIYVGSTTGVVENVSGAGDPTLAFTNYCFSGSMSGERCGMDVSNTGGQFCDDAGCTSNVAVFTGPFTAQPGDSGSPFYVGGTSNSIRGMVFARSGSTMYAEKWSVISNTFGVTIRTS